MMRNTQFDESAWESPRSPKYLCIFCKAPIGEKFGHCEPKCPDVHTGTTITELVAQVERAEGR